MLVRFNTCAVVIFHRDVIHGPLDRFSAATFLWEIFAFLVGTSYFFSKIFFKTMSAERKTQPDQPSIAYYAFDDTNGDGSPRITFMDGSTFYYIVDYEAIRKFKSRITNPGTPFLIEDARHEASLMSWERYCTSVSLPSKKNDEKSPELLFHIQTPLGTNKRTSNFILTLDTKKHRGPFTLTFPKFAFPSYLWQAQQAVISFSWKQLNRFTRDLYPQIISNSMQITNEEGDPTFTSFREIEQEVLEALVNAHDCQLLCGGRISKGSPPLKCLHLSDQECALHKFNKDSTFVNLVQILTHKYDGNNEMLNKIAKYFGQANSYAGAATHSKTKVLLLPDLNKDFSLFNAEEFADSLLATASSRVALWIITTAAPATNEVNASLLNSNKLNPVLTSELILHVPKIMLHPHPAASTYNNPSDDVHLIAYDRMAERADASKSLLMDFHVVPLSGIAPPEHMYDTNPNDRFLVDFCGPPTVLRKKDVLKRIARTGKFFFSHDNRSPRKNRLHWYVADFPSKDALDAFLEFCNAGNESRIFAMARNSLMHGNISIVRAAKGDPDPVAHQIRLKRLLGLENSCVFPLSNLATAIQVSAEVATQLPGILDSFNKLLGDTYFISCVTGSTSTGLSLTDLLPKRQDRYDNSQGASRDRNPIRRATWFRVDDELDFCNEKILHFCQSMNATNPSRAWTSNGHTSIVFQWEPKDPNVQRPPPFQYGKYVLSFSEYHFDQENITPITPHHDNDSLRRIFGLAEDQLTEDPDDEVNISDIQMDVINRVRENFKVLEPIAFEADAHADEALADAESAMQTQPDHDESKVPPPDDSGPEDGEASDGDSVETDQPETEGKKPDRKDPTKEAKSDNEGWSKPKKRKKSTKIVASSGPPGGDLAKPKEPDKTP